MSVELEVSKPAKNPKRGRVVAIAMSVVLLGLVAIFLIPRPPTKNCEFYSDESSAKTDKAQTSVILSPTDNFVDFSSLVSRAKSEVTSSLGGSLTDGEITDAKGRELSIVLGDGAPALIVHSTVTVESNDAMDIRRAIDETTYGTVELAVLCAAGDYKNPGDEISTTPESDVLKSLKVAAAQLNTSGSKDIYVFGNGIQTAGAIQMQDTDSFPKTDKLAKRFAKSLNMKREIPNLNGAVVHWYGLGQVDGVKQSTLPLAYSSSLRTFWAEVIQYGGGTLQDVCAECGTGRPNDKTIPVHAVNVSACNLIVELYEEDGVEFKPDSTKFVSRSKALNAAKTTVGKFNKKKCDALTVTGFAAAGMSKGKYLANRAEIDETNKPLTLLRAQAFAKLLTQAGFDGEITSAGGGTCGTEWDAAGAVDPRKQKLCRRVEVTN